MELLAELGYQLKGQVGVFYFQDVGVWPVYYRLGLLYCGQVGIEKGLLALHLLPYEVQSKHIELRLLRTVITQALALLEYGPQLRFPDPGDADDQFFGDGQEGLVCFDGLGGCHTDVVQGWESVREGDFVEQASVAGEPVFEVLVHLGGGLLFLHFGKRGCLMPIIVRYKTQNKYIKNSQSIHPLYHPYLTLCSWILTRFLASFFDFSCSSFQIVCVTNSSTFLRCPNLL